jgi:hypothetical protein
MTIEVITPINIYYWIWDYVNLDYTLLSICKYLSDDKYLWKYGGHMLKGSQDYVRVLEWYLFLCNI